MNAFYVFLGGGIGALMRFGLTYLIQKFPKSSFPIATLSANVIASLLLGFFIALIIKMKGPQADSFHAFWIVGICGGFSTFSTFAKENLELMERGQWIIAILNILISVSFCIAMVYLGRKMTI
ncbi:fluoride efflux transporter CrcB [Fluviicola taffensis]|uniref:Fluoride-specific ion channel FluC n=1 Tax=Fluviicola taffensis (strain DSM 16823 / NCIMB 13979 / RW262) TaxID=755732 RepID=F2IKB4_FLUTR|nr:fluoride efflux transporter CrcB [Fluviicola taffensis]AEA44017.1 CrcB-like protein [Fluviicola taffensis DSM 16823]